MTSDNPKKRTVFAVDEYTEKLKTRLEQLNQTKRPGEVSGLVSRSEILLLLESQIKDLSKQGYTARQIADALSDDVFCILPKMVAACVRKKSQSKKLAVRKKTKKQKLSAPLAEQQKEPEKTLSGASQVDTKTTYQKPKTIFIEDID